MVAFFKNICCIIMECLLCEVWKDSTGVCFTAAYIPEKTYKTSGHGTAGISESG